MTKFALCPRCEGSGTHVNPAVDGNGITAEEMNELGEDFREDYISGVYDVPCQECGGNRVVPACHCGEPVERSYSACWQHLSVEEGEDLAGALEIEAMYAAERRMGA